MDSEVPEYSHPHGHRWSGVSQEYVDKFISDHVDLVYDYMLEVENTFEAGSKIQLFIAHHTCVKLHYSKESDGKKGRKWLISSAYCYFFTWYCYDNDG